MRTAILYNFLIEANIMASIAILLMMVLRKFLRRSLGNSCICFGWALIAVRLLLPLSLTNPFIHHIRSPFAYDQAVRPIAGQVLVRARDAAVMANEFFERSGADAAAGAARSVRDSFDYGTIGMKLMVIYLAGMALVATWFIISNVIFRMKLRTGRIELISGRLHEEYLALCWARGVKAVPVYYTDPLPSACLVGVFCPYIALPLTAAPRDVIHVLTHEVCHYRNRDHLWALMRMLCCIVHWFNPLVWIAADMSRTDTELRCDDRVVAPMDAAQKQAYAAILVLAASRRTAPGVTVLATGMTMTGKRLKERVLTVLQGKKPVRAMSIAFAVVASVCLVCAFATSDAPMFPTARTSGEERFIMEKLDARTPVNAPAEAAAMILRLRADLNGGEADDPLALQTRSLENGDWFVSLTDAGTGDLFAACVSPDGLIFNMEHYPSNDMGWSSDDTCTITTARVSNKQVEQASRYGMTCMEYGLPGLGGQTARTDLVWVRSTEMSDYYWFAAEPKDPSISPVYFMVRDDRRGTLTLVCYSARGNG